MMLIIGNEILASNIAIPYEMLKIIMYGLLVFKIRYLTLLISTIRWKIKVVDSPTFGKKISIPFTVSGPKSFVELRLDKW